VNKLVAVAVGALTSATLAGSALAAPPAWCKDFASSESYDLKDLSSKDLPTLVATFAQASCAPTPEATARRAEIEAARAAWSKKLNMVDADWADAADYAGLRYHERNNRVYVNTRGQKLGIGDKLKLAWSSYDALDQWAMITNDVGAEGDFSLDDNYLVDALGANLTEVGRAAYIMACIAQENPVQWAMCQGDIAQLDLGKLATEIRANKTYSGADKMRVRIAVEGLRTKLPAHAAKIKELVAKDPGYGKLFEAAEATRKEWADRAKTDVALIQLATEMDDARATNSRKAFAGCEAKTWAAWKGAVAQVPAKKFDGMHDDVMNNKSFHRDAMGPLLSDPRVYLASVALATCMTVGQDRDAETDVLVRTLGDNMTRWPGFRGPRTATESTIMVTGIELDDRDAKLDYPDVRRSFANGGGSTSGGGAGVVGSIKPAGNTATVTFKKQLVKQQQCAAVKTTNRVTQIRGDGTLVYQSFCTKYETVTVDKAPDPQKVNARYLEGVKPGMHVSIIEDVVISARKKPGAPLPTMVFGVAVK